MSAPIAEIQSLDPGAILELFTLDTTALGGLVYNFHAGTNQLGGDVVWQGVTYQKYPVQITDLSWTGKGPLPRPTARVANVDGTLGTLVRQYDDLVGATVIYRRVLAKHLDAVNFPGGVNPTADPTAHWDDEYFEVEQKTSEAPEFIEFQLASNLDCEGARLPKRPIQAAVCVWTNADTAICPHVATCGRTLANCKTFFGPTAVLPFGGFPAASRVR